MPNAIRKMVERREAESDQNDLAGNTCRERRERRKVGRPAGQRQQPATRTTIPNASATPLKRCRMEESMVIRQP